MDVKDLMIGDWVNYSILNLNAKVFSILGNHTIGIQFIDKNNKVEAIHGLLEEVIRPIPLTEEILVKNGFSEIHHPGTGATDEYSEWFFGGIKIIEWLEDWKYHYFSAGGDGTPIDFQYVHQLQHLLRLCGIDKEIELCTN